MSRWNPFNSKGSSGSSGGGLPGTGSGSQRASANSEASDPEWPLTGKDLKAHKKPNIPMAIDWPVVAVSAAYGHCHVSTLLECKSKIHRSAFSFHMFLFKQCENKTGDPNNGSGAQPLECIRSCAKDCVVTFPPEIFAGITTSTFCPLCRYINDPNKRGDWDSREGYYTAMCQHEFETCFRPLVAKAAAMIYSGATWEFNKITWPKAFAPSLIFQEVNIEPPGRWRNERDLRLKLALDNARKEIAEEGQAQAPKFTTYSLNCDGKGTHKSYFTESAWSVVWRYIYANGTRKYYRANEEGPIEVELQSDGSFKTKQ